MWPFGKKKVRNAPHQVPKPPAATPSPVEIKRPAVRKAISALGLIKPEAEDTIGLAREKWRDGPEENAGAFADLKSRCLAECHSITRVSLTDPIKMM